MKVIGRTFGSYTVGLIDENGNWDVTVKMLEQRMLEGSTEWENREIATKCVDASFQKAYEVAMNATLAKFSDAIGEKKSDSLFDVLDEKKEDK